MRRNCCGAGGPAARSVPFPSQPSRPLTPCAPRARTRPSGTGTAANEERQPAGASPPGTRAGSRQPWPHGRSSGRGAPLAVEPPAGRVLPEAVRGEVKAHRRFKHTRAAAVIPGPHQSRPRLARGWSPPAGCQAHGHPALSAARAAGRPRCALTTPPRTGHVSPGAGRLLGARQAAGPGLRPSFRGPRAGACRHPPYRAMYIRRQAGRSQGEPRGAPTAFTADDAAVLERRRFAWPSWR